MAIRAERRAGVKKLEDGATRGKDGWEGGGRQLGRRKTKQL